MNLGAKERPLSLGGHVESRGFSHVKPRSDANSVRGLPCKNKVFYSPDIQHGRRVIKVFSSLFECAFLIISGLIRVGLPPEQKPVTKLKESLCRAGNRTSRKYTCIIAKFFTLQLCTHTLNVHKNFVPSVHSID